jgi:ATP/maltotriose-dependent transcriptional regulator MalT
LTAMLQTAGRSQKIDAALQNPWTLGHALHFSGIASYQRNEFHAAEEKLLPLVKSPYLHHALNFAHSAFALALIYQAWGRADEATEVAESVVSYALDTSNTAVLKMARAFRAELALRQGRLAEASKWAEQFTAKPFGMMYRFYVPQFTLVRVLLAQDTAESREKAGNLLTELHDFVVSTHNTRFQIDVLALQALHHDLQDDASAALKALTKSLTLAEPGGFIRLFVDLGPQMANLLKHLASQNIAVDFIGKILAAFRVEAQIAAPDTGPSPHLSLEAPKAKWDPPLSPSPSHPLSSSLTSQPLVEPLTNRELEILALLTQRLSTKEIAAKLFISPTTVKKHLNNIYGKLNVGNRREAVEKAETLGIFTR